MTYVNGNNERDREEDERQAFRQRWFRRTLRPEEEVDMTGEKMVRAFAKSLAYTSFLAAISYLGLSWVLGSSILPLVLAGSTYFAVVVLAYLLRGILPSRLTGLGTRIGLRRVAHGTLPPEPFPDREDYINHTLIWEFVATLALFYSGKFALQTTWANPLDVFLLVAYVVCRCSTPH